jgi:hypothetical protein
VLALVALVAVAGLGFAILSSTGLGGAEDPVSDPLENGTQGGADEAGTRQRSAGTRLENSNSGDSPGAARSTATAGQTNSGSRRLPELDPAGTVRLDPQRVGTGDDAEERGRTGPERRRALREANRSAAGGTGAALTGRGAPSAPTEGAESDPGREPGRAEGDAFKLDLVLAGTSADRLGLTPGDRITHMGDVEIRNWDDIKEAHVDKTLGDPLPIIWVDADGVTHTETVEIPFCCFDTARE